MNKQEKEKAKMVLAMEFIARHINNEDIFEKWLMCGVADGDIPYGDLTNIENPVLECYTDSYFDEIVDEFLRVMKLAYLDGGLYVR